MRTFTKKSLQHIRTGPERLLDVLLDGARHATSELVRRVGHTFPVFKWILVHRDKYTIAKEKHPVRPFEYNYWLVPDDEAKAERRPRLLERVKARVHARTRSFASVAL